ARGLPDRARWPSSGLAARGARAGARGAGGRDPSAHGVRRARLRLPSHTRLPRRQPRGRGGAARARAAPVPAHPSRGPLPRRGPARPAPRAHRAERCRRARGRRRFPGDDRPPPAHRSRHLPGGGRVRRARIPAWLTVVPTGFVLAWGGNHFTPLLHVYETVGGYAPWQANLLLGMYVVGLIPGMLLAAGLSDRHGRRVVAVAGLAAAALASVLLAAGIGSFAVLCAGRVLAGIGVGVGMSVGSSWIKELSSAPHDLRATPTAG